MREWNNKTQERISLTGSALTGMRSIRMTGVAATIKALVAKHRDDEVQASISYRWIVVFLNFIVHIPELTTPIVLFAAYIIKAKVQHTGPLGTAEALTSLSILTLLQEPAAQVLIALPLAAGSLGALGRIQDYLLLPTKSGNTVPERVDAAHGSENGVELTVIAPKYDRRQDIAF